MIFFEIKDNTGKTTKKKKKREYLQIKDFGKSIFLFRRQ